MIWTGNKMSPFCNILKSNLALGGLRVQHYSKYRIYSICSTDCATRRISSHSKMPWWGSALFTKQSSLVYFYLKEMKWESDIPYFLLPCNMQFNATTAEWLRDWMSIILYYSPFMNVGMKRRWPENEWETDRAKANVRKQGKHFLDNINIGPFVPWCFSNNITTSLMKCLKDKLSFSCISPAVGCRGELLLSAACCVIYNDFVKWNPIMLHFCKEDMFYPAVL